MKLALRKARTNLPTGWESEFNVTRNGDPVDLRSLMSSPRLRRGDHAQVSLDAGRDQVEANTNASYVVGDHVAELEWYYRVLERRTGLTLHFDPRRRVGTPVTEDDFFKPRLQKMLEALQHPSEGGANGKKVIQSGNINAFHVHFGVTDVFSDEATLIMNLLNAATPAVTRWVHDEFDLARSQRNSVWTFARKERLPAPRWFPNFAAYHTMFEQVPRLLKPVGASSSKHGGEWDVDLETMQVLGDSAAESAMWWGTRIRPLHKTVEYRPTPIMANPLHLARLVVELDAWLETAVGAVGDRQFATFDEAMQSGHVPAFMDIPLPTSEGAWWSGWRQY